MTLILLPMSDAFNGVRLSLLGVMEDSHSLCVHDLENIDVHDARVCYDGNRCDTDVSLSRKLRLPNPHVRHSSLPCFSVLTVVYGTIAPTASKEVVPTYHLPTGPSIHKTGWRWLCTRPASST